MITENLSTLKIHKLTQEQYDRVVAAGDIDKSAIYLTPDNTKLSAGDGESSTVIGTGSATGTESTVIGTGTASGEGATVIGNGTASGDYSVAEGDETIAGCEGYYIAAIDTTNHYIYLHTSEDSVIPSWKNPSSFYDKTFNSGYQILNEIESPYGNEFSVSSDGYNHWVFAANIVEINGNRIKYHTDNILNEDPKWQSNLDGNA